MAWTKLFKSISVEPNLYDPLEVVANRLGIQVQKEDRVVQEQDAQQQSKTTAEAELTDMPDTMLDTSQH